MEKREIYGYSIGYRTSFHGISIAKVATRDSPTRAEFLLREMLDKAEMPDGTFASKGLEFVSVEPLRKTDEEDLPPIKEGIMSLEIKGVTYFLLSNSE